MIRLFGTDFLVDGSAMGPGDITALPGQVRTGVLSGILESGGSFEVAFQIEDGAAIRIVPEASTGLLWLVGLILAANRGNDPRLTD